MKIQDLVSIVVPVHNGEEFLRENVECILQQSYDNLEIIYVCDGCTDNTVDILQGYAVSDSRMKIYIGQEKHGTAFARNTGMGMANGEWIIFLDCDDLFERNMIEGMLYKAIEEKADMCCCFWEEFDSEPVCGLPVANAGLKRYCKTYPVINVTENRKYILQLVIHAPWSKLIHKTIYQKQDVYFQSLPNNNDTYFSFCSAVESSKIVYVDEIFVHYRSSEGRKALSEGRKKIKNYVWEAYDKFYQYIEKKADNGELKQSFYNRVCTGIISLAGCSLYKNLFRELYETYFSKWGMDNSDIQDKLSFFNQEIYIKLCSGEWLLDKYLIMEQAKEHFVREMVRRGSSSIWGCGCRVQKFLMQLKVSDLGIQHLYDSDSNKWGIEIAGKTVENYDGQWADNIIVTCPQYYEEIKEKIGNRAGCVYNLDEDILRY